MGALHVQLVEICQCQCNTVTRELIVNYYTILLIH